MNLKYLLIFFVFALGLSSCDDCAECGQPGQEPGIRVKFFAQDSINKLTSAISEVNQEINAIKALSEAERELQKDNLKALETKLDKLSIKRELLRRNRVRIDSIRALEVNNLQVLRDTLDLFRFPLNMYSDVSSYVIYLHGRKDTLRLSYNRNIVTKDQAIKFEMNNLKIKVIGYDSITALLNSKEHINEIFKCADKRILDCLPKQSLSNETTINIYF
jgi:hypothetical protein